MVGVNDNKIVIYICHSQLTFRAIGVFGYKTHSYLGFNFGRKILCRNFLKEFLLYIAVSFFLGNGNGLFVVYFHIHQSLFKTGDQPAFAKSYLQRLALQRTVKDLAVIEFSGIVKFYGFISCYLIHTFDFSII